jgi:hypothetical protein
VTSVRLHPDLNRGSTEITLARERTALFTRHPLIALSGIFTFYTWQRHQRCVAALKQQARGDSRRRHFWQP